MEPVAERPRRILFDANHRLYRLHAIGRAVDRNSLDVNESEHVGVVEPLARKRPVVKVDRLAKLELQRFGEHLAVGHVQPGRFDAVQDLLRAFAHLKRQDDRVIGGHRCVGVDVDVIETELPVLLFDSQARVVDGGNRIRCGRRERGGFLDRTDPLVRDTGPPDLGHFRARTFVDLEQQHAGRTVDRQRPAVDLRLQEPFLVVDLLQGPLDQRPIKPRFELQPCVDDLGKQPLLAQLHISLEAELSAADRRARCHVDAHALGIRRGPLDASNDDAAEFAGGDQVAPHAMREVLDEELVEHILVPRLLELGDQRRRRRDAVHLQNGVRPLVHHEFERDRSRIVGFDAARSDPRFEEALPVKRLADAIDRLLQLEEVERVAGMQRDLPPGFVRAWRIQPGDVDGTDHRPDAAL